MLTQFDVIWRLLVAGILGGLIGFEREMHHQPAGLRTHIILVLGAALAMCISINLSMQFHTTASNGDPERLAAQVISGIGFLGAGAIFRFGAGVKGLTTASSLWTAAIIGLAVGAGYFLIGVITTAIVLFALKGLDLVEKRLIRGRMTRTIIIRGADRPGFVDEVKSALTNFDIALKSISLQKNLKNNEIQIETLAKVFPDQDLDAIIGAMSKMEGLSEFRFQ
ncbi:MAG TPA: MgtC/SapB family protein [Kiritimatiellia bacterium]|nr:MgtC/SapB family protein [Kiritimatiellia bacterium]